MTDPNENRPGYKKTKVGWIPEPWTCSTLGSTVRLLSGGTPSKDRPDYWNGSVPWYSARDLRTFRLSSSALCITGKGPLVGTRQVPPNTVLLLGRGMMLNRAFPGAITTRHSCFNQDLKRSYAAHISRPLFSFLYANI